MNSRPYLGETVKLTKGEYTSKKKILDEIRLKTELEKLDFVIDPITKHLSLWLHYLLEGKFFQARKLLLYLESKASEMELVIIKITNKEARNIARCPPKMIKLTIPLMYVLLLSIYFFPYIILFQKVGHKKTLLLLVIDTNRSSEKGLRM